MKTEIFLLLFCSSWFSERNYSDMVPVEAGNWSLRRVTTSNNLASKKRRKKKEINLPKFSEALSLVLECAWLKVIFPVMESHEKYRL